MRRDVCSLSWWGVRQVVRSLLARWVCRYGGMGIGMVYAYERHDVHNKGRLRVESII
jgi:hypothetical protein